MYKNDREWEGIYHPQVCAILTPLLPQLAEIVLAPVETDMKRATDYVVRLKSGIAVRLRRSKYKYRDLTIRAHRDNGVKTELAKIKEGYGHRYFYGWTDEQDTISEWILVDLDKLRLSGLLDKPLKDNHDGTYFIAIEIEELQSTGCLIASQVLAGVA